MHTLNAPLPFHLYCLVRTPYLRNLEDDRFDELEEAAVFGIASVPNRALGFHVHLRSGAIFWRVPISALAWHADAPHRPTSLLQTWDSFGYQLSVTAFPYLRERDALVRMKDGTEESGVYVCTIDWLENGYSDQPDQHKCAHLLRLYDGNFTLQPNDRLLWADASFSRERSFAGLRYRSNTHAWYAEDDVGAPPMDLGARKRAESPYLDTAVHRDAYQDFGRGLVELDEQRPDRRMRRENPEGAMAGDSERTAADTPNAADAPTAPEGA